MSDASSAAVSDRLRVMVRRSGGVTGIGRSWSLTASELRSDRAADLRRLVADADAALAAPPARPPPGLPDAFSYDVEVNQPGADRRATGVASPSGPLRALIDFVRAYGLG